MNVQVSLIQSHGSDSHAKVLKKKKKKSILYNEESESERSEWIGESERDYVYGDFRGDFLDLRV